MSYLILTVNIWFINFICVSKTVKQFWFGTLNFFHLAPWLFQKFSTQIQFTTTLPLHVHRWTMFLLYRANKTYKQPWLPQPSTTNYGTADISSPSPALTILPSRQNSKMMRILRLLEKTVPFSISYHSLVPIWHIALKFKSHVNYW